MTAPLAPGHGNCYGQERDLSASGRNLPAPILATLNAKRKIYDKTLKPLHKFVESRTRLTITPLEQTDNLYCLSECPLLTGNLVSVADSCLIQPCHPLS